MSHWPLIRHKRRGYLVSIRPHWDTKGTGETEIGQLEIIMLVDEEILRLEISVEYTMRMTVQQARGELMRKFLKR